MRWPSLFYGALAATVIDGCSHPSRQSDAVADTTAADSDAPSVPPPGVARHFKPPTGFYGYPWGTPLTVIEADHPGLTMLTSQTVEWGGKTQSINMECAQYDPKGNCKRFELEQYTAGGGVEAFGEYYDPAYGYRYKDTGAFMHPAIMEFCAHYGGSIPKTLHADLKLCGVRLMYYTEPTKRADTSAPNEVGNANEADSPSNPYYNAPNYERVLLSLIHSYGYPHGYRKTARVIVEAADGIRITSRHKPRFLDYHWCGIKDDRDISPRCDATVSDVFNPDDGWGVVLFSTPPVYAYAVARHDMGDVDNLIYRLLHDRGMNKLNFPSDLGLGDGCLDCRPESEPMAAKLRAMFETHSSGRPMQDSVSSAQGPPHN
jgi:hypothetical protein